MTSETDDAPNQLRKEHPEIDITGLADKHRAPYWAGAMAALGMRYLPRPFWRKKFERPDTTDSEFFQKHKYAAASGAMMLGVSGIYAKRTYDDIHSVFAKAVAYETGKDPKDIGIGDLLGSENSVVQQTMDNFVKRNAVRLGVNSVFFVPFLMKGTMRKFKLGGETGIDWGVGANAGYLFADVLFRKISPFEELQSLIDRKVNHAEHFADKIVANDVLDVYERHAANDASKSFMNQRGTPAWDTSMELFDRVADLLNQTYKNTPVHEQGNFGFPELIYLMGHQLIDPDNVERSRAYIEVANKLGIPEVKHMQEQLKNGAPLASIMEGYGLTKAPEVEPAAQVEKRFATPELKKSSIQHGGSMREREEARRASHSDSMGLAI